MSKIRDKSLKLKDNQRVYFGDNNEGSIHFDGSQLQIESTTDIDIRVSPGGDGAVVLDGMSFPVADGSDGNALKTDGSGQMFWQAFPGDRGVFGGGSGVTDAIDYIAITSPSNAADFGDLTVARAYLGACSNGANDRAVFAEGGNGGAKNTIDYITISTAGNATDFGDATTSLYYISSTSNGTNERGIFAGGGNPSNNTIGYVTINSVGNATDFGNLTAATKQMGATSNRINDRAVMGGGDDGSVTETIEYITVSSVGNATDFGDLTAARTALTGCSNGISERGIFAGGEAAGSTKSNVIEYVTINSTGNGTDFGDLTAARNGLTSTSNGATGGRGVFGGGNEVAAVDTIEYITIGTLSNATDFGDLTAVRSYPAATSNA